MMLLTFFLVALACAHGAILPRVPTLEGGRIIGGAPARITDVPSQSALLLDFWNVGTFAQTCGSSVIARNVILTAAHCITDYTTSQLRVRAGSAFHNTGGQVVGVSGYILHPGYNQRLDNDIALVFLQSQLTLSNEVALSVLPMQGQEVADNANALISGWGSITEGGTQPTQLYKVNITTVNLLQCVQIYSTFNPVTERMVCAGRLGVGGADGCQGDSGGPLFVGNYQVGIASWGRGCAQPAYPGVYTRIASFRNWIESNIDPIREH